MIYCKGSKNFLKSVDALDNIKDNKYIYGLLKDVIKEVGEWISICKGWEIVNEEVQFILDSMCNTLHRSYV